MMKRRDWFWMEKREQRSRRRGERERGKEKMSNAFGEGAVSKQSPTVKRNKQNKGQERKMEVISKKNIFIRCFYVHKKINM
jgi:hypothetical protein